MKKARRKKQEAVSLSFVSPCNLTKISFIFVFSRHFLRLQTFG